MRSQDRMIDIHVIVHDSINSVTSVAFEQRIFGAAGGALYVPSLLIPGDGDVSNVELVECGIHVGSGKLVSLQPTFVAGFLLRCYRRSAQSFCRARSVDAGIHVTLAYRQTQMHLHLVVYRRASLLCRTLSNLPAMVHVPLQIDQHHVYGQLHHARLVLFLCNQLMQIGTRHRVELDQPKVVGTASNVTDAIADADLVRVRLVVLGQKARGADMVQDVVRISEGRAERDDDQRRQQRKQRCA